MSTAGTADTFSTSRFNSSGGSSSSSSLASAFSKLSSFSSSTLRRPLGTGGSVLGTAGLSASALYGTSAEEKVVLDIGSFSLRAGFSGDSAPLHTSHLVGELSPASVGGSGRRLIGRHRGLYDLPLANADEEVLELLLVEQVRELYRTQLLMDPKSRKVAVAEGALLPVPLKRILARVLLGNLRVPQITFYPSSVLALMTCGLTTGLVVDCGHHGTTVVPVYDARPMAAYVVSTPVGGQLLYKSVRELLKKFAEFVPFADPETTEKRSVTDDLLTDELVYHIMTRLLYASPVAVPRALHGEEFGAGRVSDKLVEWFEQSMTSAHEVTTLTTQGGTLRIPGWVRERAAEVLLAGDKAEDQAGVVECIAKCLQLAPIDTRRSLAKKILVVGGVADLPHLRVRILHDLVAHLRTSKGVGSQKWQALADYVALAEEPGAALAEAQEAGAQQQPQATGGNGQVFRPSDRCWIGASLAAAARIGGVDVKRDEFDGVNLPDWTTALQS
ncbi:actin-like ATPase domain-containing protein [Martensiomyces pterosporus]|nr:actin-like ATPase domain-containing protein [Martensiomyces pterosporus]